MEANAQHRYSPLDPESRDAQSLDSEDCEKLGFLQGTVSKRESWRPSRGLWWFSLCNSALFLVSLSLFSIWFYQTHLVPNAKLRQASSYTPIHDLLDLHMQEKKINGTLFPAKQDASIARHAPSPETDAIWNEWELTRIYPVTSQQIRAMGKDPSTAAKLEDADWGLGDDAYAAIFDVYHQLHCLNFLRKLIYPKYYNTSHWHHSDVEGFFEVHMNHCVDIIMQAIQCSGNVNLITMHWVETQPYPFPDMSVNRQCVDFESLTQWRLDNTIDMDKYDAVMMKPPGVKQLEAPDGYYDFFPPNQTNTNHQHGASHGGDVNL